MRHETGCLAQISSGYLSLTEMRQGEGFKASLHGRRQSEEKERNLVPLVTISITSHDNPATGDLLLLDGGFDGEGYLGPWSYRLLGKELDPILPDGDRLRRET
jgi:hypothetical protein